MNVEKFKELEQQQVAEVETEQFEQQVEKVAAKIEEVSIAVTGKQDMRFGSRNSDATMAGTPGDKEDPSSDPDLSRSMFMFQALMEPISLPDDYERAQYFPGAVDLIQFIAWVRAQLRAVEAKHVEFLHERVRDQAKIVARLLRSSSVTTFPTDFNAYVKGAFPKVTCDTFTSMLGEMLKTVPFIATDTIRTIAYVPCPRRF
ncbi:hypothetical protein GGF31_007521 [Allomyces arbusculus]|nr:hypothetical protein GGF31_007521 [Allomyces arbusculus]